MWLIPGDTKVKIEIFKGIGIFDMLVGLVGLGIAVLLFMSNLPFKLVATLVILVITVFLVLSIDDQPNYIFLLNIIKFLTFTHKYDIRITPVEEDAKASKKKRGKKSREDANDPSIIEEMNKDLASGLLEPQPYTKAELKARRAAEKAEYKADTKLLKSKKLSKEEEDAIWLKRAKQEAENKKIRKQTREANAKIESVAALRPYTDIKDNLISYAGRYYGAVMEIPPVEFRFFSDFRRQNTIVNGLGQALRTLSSDYAFNLVKLERKVDYTAYRQRELERIDALKKSFELGMIKEEELQRRIDVLYGRIEEIEQMMGGDPVIVPYFYLVVYDTDRTLLENQVRQFMDTLRKGEMHPRRLRDKEIAIFLKYTNELDFNEKEIDDLPREEYVNWASPSTLDIRHNTVAVNGLLTQNMRVIRYPATAGNAWLASVMSLPSTKVVVKCTPMDREKSVRSIDRSLMELRGTLGGSMMDSRRLELEEHVESLQSLLQTLQGETESLLATNIYVTSYDVVGTEKDTLLAEHVVSERRRNNNMRKYVKHVYREKGMRLSSMNFEQMETFIGSQISGYDPYLKNGRGIPSNTIGAAYPWIFPTVADKDGIRLGNSDGVPVFLNMFQRDSLRVNSNAVIVGKSGSGKSYATKTLLTNLATDDARIFILDPENEYAELSQNLGGKFINVGNASNGRLNPFQIMTTLEDEGEEEEKGPSDSFSMHLQFLEEFFQQIMPDCDKDALEYLNTIVERMYAEKGITIDTDISKLKPEDYPIFDDLYDSVLREFQRTENEFLRSMLRTLMNYVAKFAADGRNANIWNGYSSITTDENFCVFNFQSLLSNRNGSIANAQMLLVLKYLDNEIIKNREYNLKYHTSRKIIVVIDEAHVFIDTKFPIALDFMFQLAKRIRKYNGMQIVITQNIKDFVGSEDIARKSTAIINACQYSFIFSLAPNDMADLCTLYEKSGGINDMEQEQIVNAQRGEAFMILGPTSRTSFSVDARPDVRKLFEDTEYESSYFSDEAGKTRWNELIGESREIRSEKLLERFLEQEQEEEAAMAAADAQTGSGSFHFQEIDESDWLQMEEAKEAEETKAREEAEKSAAEAARKAAEEAARTAAEEAARRAEETAARMAAENEALRAAQAGYRMAENAAAPSRVEEMLTEMLGNFSHAAMQSEINRKVEEEVQKRLDSVMGTLKNRDAIPQTQAAYAEEPAEETYKSYEADEAEDRYAMEDTSEEYEEEEEDTEEDMFSSLFDEDTEDASEEYEEEEEEDSEEDTEEDMFSSLFDEDTEDASEEYEEEEEDTMDDMFSSLFDEDTEAVSDEYEEDSETGDDLFSGMFADEETAEEEAPADDEDEDNVEDSDFLRSLFGFDDEEEDSEEDESEEEDQDFDLGSLLGDMFEEMDEISSIEQMNLYGDTVIDITIEDLTKYVKNMRNASN